jgi:hypothetical protein
MVLLGYLIRCLKPAIEDIPVLRIIRCLCGDEEQHRNSRSAFLNPLSMG